MHTDIKDVHGQDLEAIIHELGLTQGQVLFSQEKVSSHDLAAIYNAVDVTINISDAEGFGLATLESLYCGTPIVVSMTGGLQFQVTDGKKFFGAGLEPVSKAIIGSQEVPYIYEDRISKEDFVAALTKLYEMTPEERTQLGAEGLAHAHKEFNFEDFVQRWDDLLTEVHETKGSWDTRSGYQSYEMRTL
jgi:glycosyltransferase involved in cell wall biosynthesis